MIMTKKKKEVEEMMTIIMNIMMMPKIIAAEPFSYSGRAIWS